MLIQAQVGPAVSSTSLGVGTQPNLRLDNLGGLTASQLLPRYYETTYRRQVYTIANQSGVVTTATLTSGQTYTGLFIQNPTNSTVNAVITKAGWAIAAGAVVPANAGIVAIATGIATTNITSAVTPRNRFVGGVASQILASTSLSLPSAPVLETIIGSFTNAATLAPNLVDLEGSLILTPGAYALIYTSAASSGSTGNFFGSLQWTEVPL